MAFPVARRAFNDRIVISDSRFLRSARNAVDVGDERDDRFAAPIGGDPRGGNACNAMLDVKPVLLEDAGDVPRRFVFLEAQFAEAKNFVHHLLREHLQLVYLRHCFLLYGGKLRLLLREQSARREQRRCKTTQYTKCPHRIPPSVK